MQIFIVVGFMLVLVLPEVPGISVDTSELVGLLIVYVLGAVLLGALNTWASLRSFDRSEGAIGEEVRRHGRVYLLTHIWLVAGLGVLILVGMGERILQDTPLGRIPLLGRIAILSPFILGVILLWLLDYPFYRRVRRRIARQQQLTGLTVREGWSLREYLTYNLRHHLLFIIVPVSLIMLITDTLHLYIRPLLPPRFADSIEDTATVAAVALILITAPLIISRIWKTAPLGDTPLRRRLEKLCRRFGLHYRDILVWVSGGMIVNAAVMGMVGRFRYLLLTDALIENMDEVHIESIFAHEARHVASHHIPYTVLFVLVCVALCAMGGQLLAGVLGRTDLFGDILSVGMLVGFGGAGFGWMSRRFERECDVNAAWVSSCQQQDPDPDDRITPEGAAVFAQALGSVARLNGIPMNQRRWRHGSVAHRIGYVLWLGSTRGTRRDITRTVKRIKCALWAGLLLVVLLVAASRWVGT